MNFDSVLIRKHSSAKGLSALSHAIIWKVKVIVTMPGYGENYLGGREGDAD